MESEIETKQTRIDQIPTSLGWKVVSFVERHPLTALSNYPLEEHPTDNSPADQARCVHGEIVAIVEAKKLTLGPLEHNDEPAAELLLRVSQKWITKH